MAETKKTTKAAPKKTTSKNTSKPAGKKISVTVEKEFYTELEEYTHKMCISIEEFAKKAIKEKMDRDRISTMIDYFSK